MSDMINDFSRIEQSGNSLLGQVPKDNHKAEPRHEVGLKNMVMSNEVVGGKIEIAQVVSKIKGLLELNKEMLEEAPPDYKKMAESNALTALLHWLESQREA